VSWRSACSAFLLAVGLAGAPAARAQHSGHGDEAATLWVLPLESLGPDPALADLARAVMDLLVVGFSRSDTFAVVERERLASLLAEQSLTAASLAEPGTRRTLGKLLGARWMLHGSLARRGTRLRIAVHVSEVASTRVLASAEIEVEPPDLARGLSELTAKLVRALSGSQGTVAPGELDPTPVASLHFLRGLGAHYSGEHHLALAEFLRAGAEPALADTAALWRARTYLALAEPAHAYLELARLERRGTHALDRRDLEERLARCRSSLSAEELRTCEALLAAGRR
jgi:TolB-like protein